MTPVMVVGASARAAVASARRAGWCVSAVDLFADRDTKTLTHTVKGNFDGYPRELLTLAGTLPPGPWFYVGGLENYPDAIAELCQTRELLGHGPEAIAKVRNSVWVKDLAITKSERPEFSIKLPGDYASGSPNKTLRKKTHSSGGLGVSWYDGSLLSSSEYLQPFIPGEIISAQFRGSTFLGCTEVLCGIPEFHAPEFHYAGNIGPLVLPKELIHTLKTFGETLALHANLTWLWGADLIVNATGIYLLEVNPRMTAALEVLEHAQGTALAVDGPGLSRCIIGKAILYAPHTLTIPAMVPWEDVVAQARNVWQLPEYADIPHEGERFEAGQPVVTRFVKGYSAPEVRVKLIHLAKEMDEVFALWRTS